MTEDARHLVLSLDDLRAVAGFAAACAQDTLDLFERAQPEDSRPRDAIDAALAFSGGGRRGRLLRDTAWAAQRAAATASSAAAAEAARAAMAAAGAAYLHPLRNATQVRHILGAAAHAARAEELAAGGDPGVGAARIALLRQRATLAVVDVLRRYPAAPSGGGRTGALMRELDAALRDPS